MEIPDEVFCQFVVENWVVEADDAPNMHVERYKRDVEKPGYRLSNIKLTKKEHRLFLTFFSYLLSSK